MIMNWNLSELVSRRSLGLKLSILALAAVAVFSGLSAQAQTTEPPAVEPQPSAPAVVTNGATPAVTPAVAPAKTEKREAVVNGREANQDKRIEQGIKSGQLNAKEAANLEKREQHIDKMEEQAMADGKMTKKEFKRIEKAQDRTSRQIYKKKHNGRRG